MNSRLVPHDTAASALDALVRAVPTAPPDAQPLVASRMVNGWAVLVVAAPLLPPEAAALTECEKDCLVLLARAGVPLSGLRCHRLLDREDIGVWGVATVKRALARLKRRGLVNGSRFSPRGYSLPPGS